MTFYKKVSAIWWVLCLGLLLPMTTVADDDAEEEDGEDTTANIEEWRQLRKEMQQEAKKKLDEWLDKNVTKEKVTGIFARKWTTWNPKTRKFNLPLQPPWTWNKNEPHLQPSPMRSVDKVKEELDFTLEKQYRRENPEPRREELLRQGREKYPMFKIDTRISFTIREGKGTNTIVSGKFKSINNEYIVIGQRFIARQDLDEETLALFYEEKNDELVEDFINSELRKYKAKLENWVYSQSVENLPALLLKEGFVPKPRSRVPGTPGYEEKPKVLFVIEKNRLYISQNSELSPNTKLWESREASVERAYRILYEEQKARMMPYFEAEVFKDPELDPKWVVDNGEWVPSPVAEERRKAQAEAAKAKQENN